ncbi:hypothetical protein UB43_10900 [Pseudomonas sp. 21]|uniref:hypothetical protein n=1 Tax=unclassified Pseudomonas TaxID=196821 RepID=UPI0005EBCDFA|nr:MULTISPECIES: hypothetical protein [unclassified Pseudomonas]KJK00908.1 hypothetical protein UB43_10900 [Pseudomonas sp. 21]MBV7581798.1 hypothetical protein [Pseudomonas sp. PDM33]
MTDTPQDNPFQTPTAVLQDTATTATGEPLYRLAAVGIATFFGTPIAGAWVIVQNLKALGRRHESRNIWLMGIGLTLAILVLGYFLPENTSGTPIAVGTVVGMYYLAKQTFGVTVERHLVAGGQWRSNWRAFGISLLFLLAVIAVILVVSFFLVYILGVEL